MAKNKKATFPIWETALENVAQKRSSKDQLKNNPPMVKGQPLTPRGSQRSRVLIHMKTFGSLTTLQRLREMGLLRLAARVHELRKVGYPILTYKACGLTNRSVAKYILQKSRQRSLFDFVDIGRR